MLQIVRPWTELLFILFKLYILRSYSLENIYDYIVDQSICYFYIIYLYLNLYKV